MSGGRSDDRPDAYQARRPVGLSSHKVDTMDVKAVSMNQAAAMLNTTSDAIRKRLKRGTLQGAKNEAGHWVIYLQADTPPGQSADEDKSGRSVSPDTEGKPSGSGAPVACPGCSQLMIERAALSATLEAKTEQINALQEQIINLQRERDNWQLQALTTIQAITSSNSPLTLPGAVGQIPERAEGEGVGLWARLKGFMKVGRPGRS